MATFFSLLVIVRLLFEGSIYSLGKPTDINDSRIRHVQVIQWQLLDAVSSTHSLTVLLLNVETSHTTQTALALAQWSSSEIICICVYSSRSYYSRAVFISLRASDCAATIWRQWQFEGSDYLKKYGIHNMKWTLTLTYLYGFLCQSKQNKSICGQITQLESLQLQQLCKPTWRLTSSHHNSFRQEGSCQHLTSKHMHP